MDSSSHPHSLYLMQHLTTRLYMTLVDIIKEYKAIKNGFNLKTEDYDMLKNQIKHAENLLAL